METKSNRAQERQQIVNFFYHHFVMRHKIAKTESFFKNRKLNFSDWQTETFTFIFSHYNFLLAKIEPNIGPNWTFNEISHLDKAILLVATGEFFADITPRSIAITEAIKASRLYGGHNSYRFVNKTLDKTLIAKSS